MSIYIKKIVGAVKDFFKDLIVLPPTELSSEVEEEIITKIAEAVKKTGTGLPSSILGRLFTSTSTVVSQVYVMPLVLYFDLLGLDGFEIVAFLDKKENVKRLIDKIQENEMAYEYFK